MDSIERQIKINGVKSGVILGVIVTALSIASFYFITATPSPAMFVGGPIIFAIFLPIFCVTFLCFKARKDVGGYWTFKQATTGIFTMFLVAFVLQFIGKDIIFDKFVEPGNALKVQTAAVNAKAAILKQRGNTPQVIDKDIAELKKDFTQPAPTIGSTIQGIIISIIFIFILAMVFGALFKREPPGMVSNI